jgi:hypothetical protein
MRETFVLLSGIFIRFFLSINIKRDGEQIDSAWFYLQYLLNNLRQSFFASTSFEALHPLLLSLGF